MLSGCPALIHNNYDFIIMALLNSSLMLIVHYIESLYGVFFSRP